MVSHSLLFSPDNEFLAVRNRSGMVQVWNWRQRTRIFPRPDTIAGNDATEGTIDLAAFGANARMQFTPDSASLAILQANGLMRVFALATGKEQKHFSLERAPFQFLRFSPAGEKFCLVHRDEHVQLHRTSDGHLLKMFPLSSGAFSVAWHPDGRRLATGAHDRKAHIWDTETGEELASFAGHQSAVSQVTFSHNGQLLVTSSWDTTTRVWDAENGKELLNLRTGGYCPQFSRDDRRFVRANPATDNLPEVYEVALGDEVRTLAMPEESEYTNDLQFSPDGRLLVSSQVNVNAIWDTSSARRLATFRGDRGGAVCLVPMVEPCSAQARRDWNDATSNSCRSGF